MNASAYSGIRFHSSQATSTVPAFSDDAYPKLSNMPSYPLVGSLIYMLRQAGTPHSIMKPYSFWPEMHKRFGDFYTIGLPGTGSKKDSHGTLHVLTDPKEMIKVIRAGGSFPSGAVEDLWVIKKWNKLQNMHSAPLLENGDEWKRMRTFMQTDLMSPDSARGYVPGMIQTAQIASKVVPAYKNDLNQFLAFSAFDLFSAIAFGEMMRSVDPDSNSDPENNIFARTVHEGIGLSIQLGFDLFETTVCRPLGITSKRQQECFDQFDKAWEIGRKKIDRFIERKERGALTENEMNSYLNRAIDRQREGGSGVSRREAQELVYIGLFAAIDTTSSYLGWALFHIARTPHVQEKLYQELAHSVATVGNGKLTDQVLDRKNAPYLHAVIRESHRISPTNILSIIKRIDKKMEVNGIQMEPGDVMSLENYSTGINPDFVDEPEKFLPERWSPEAVESRKGTPSEIIDHPFLKAPFSQGARRCPGSRVAANETQVMIAQLVLDWKMTSSVSSMEDIEYKQKTTVELTIPPIEFEARS